ncbi:MAG: ribosome rescue protein RqcH [Nitrososphaeraceae archaeon]
MELSGLELRYIVNHINNRIMNGYYVSQISGITKDSFTIKLHHSRNPEVILMISTKGIWISKMSFKQAEENTLARNIKKELERSRIISLEQSGSERIVVIKFEHYAGEIRFLVCEFFGNGNIILCDEKMNIIFLLNPIEVRHRTLRVGIKYVPPPKRGYDVFEISISEIKASITNENSKLDVARWLGREFSIPKKFVEELIIRGQLHKKKIDELSEEEILTIYNTIRDLINEVIDENNHKPIIIFDKSNNPVNVEHKKLYDSKDIIAVPSKSFMDGIDQVLSNQLITAGKRVFTEEIDQKISILRHDLAEQDKAKQHVLSKSTSLRKLASELMYSSSSNIFELENLLKKHSAKIVLEKGKKYLNIMEEQMPIEDSLPKLSSNLFIRAKELERGSEKIDNLRSKIFHQIDELSRQTVKMEKNLKIKNHKSKEWFERYRWFFTSEGYLVIGGRDASSNSAIIRKHMTEQDIVFHAEIHGSPFFLIKNLKSNTTVFDENKNLLETAIATVSFSRAWREGLSAADSYWILPDQVKKGAPSGQFVPKGSFVIEGKRNFIKGIGLKLAIGIFKDQNSYNFICGPQISVENKSTIYGILLPGGMDPMNAAKKIKSEFIKFLQNNKNTNILEEMIIYLKGIPLDDIIRLFPPGKIKLISIEKGSKYEAI